MKKYIWALLLSVLTVTLPAQIIETEPSIVTLGQPITVYFNSDEDTGELKNYTGDVYTHTGVILEGSSNWVNVIGDWSNNTNQPELTYLGDYRYKLEITPSIEEFYPNMTGDEDVVKLAFVFRDASADLQTADLFVDVYEAGLNVTITNPADQAVIVELDEDLGIEASATLADSLVLFVDNNRTYKSDDPALLTYTVPADEYGGKWIKVNAYSLPDVASDSVYLFVKSDPVVEDLPPGAIDGINYTGDNSVTLVLTAPGKSDVFVLGDFNDWLISEQGYMKKTPDGEKFWISIGGLTAGQEYRFQYLVDETIKTGEPYTEKVLDPWNDEYITDDIYPDLIEYPEGKTTGLVSVLQTAEPDYEWTITDFDRPDKGDLVIYELLMRDFLASHHYLTLIDTLDYLQNLGVNAIELMPVNEFDGNLSWGYNPAYYLAPDKYYGTKNDLKALVDSCHRRGIAVILDIVLNHSTGSSPMAALYWNDGANNVTAENPWYNVTATHDYNVFHDFNHESEYTREFSKRVMTHWIEEYNVDGYRFDLSKGFTQNNTLGNVSAWNAYDASRVAIWKMYADHIWSIDPDFYVILEHFADNTEEKELAEYGMMLWGNMNGRYSELSMGFPAYLDWGSYLVRDWNIPHLVAYNESHDEERMMYRNLNWGNSSGNYNVQNPVTASNRLILAATLFFTVPGPKMLWQFGELGYDYSIDYNGRTGEKPIKWDYFNDPDRNRVYWSFAALINLRNEHPAFSSSDFEVVDEGMRKRIKISHESMNVIVLGNFDVSSGLVGGDFHNTGWWYEYFTGDSINITDPGEILELGAGEYRIYTSEKLTVPDISLSVDDVFYEKDYDRWFTIYPNPVDNIMYIDLDEEYSGRTVDVHILDISGRQVYSADGFSDSYLDLGRLPRGMYFIRLTTTTHTATRRFIKY